MLSSNKELFDLYKRPYEEALAKAGYREKLEYVEGPVSKNGRNRGRKITWFNPPFTVSLKTNLGKDFLTTMDQCFPQGHPLRKIINRNNIKVSYSCMPSMDRRIKGMNASKLEPKQSEESREDTACKCRATCPLEGNCKTSNLIYRARIKANQLEHTYIGLTSTQFIQRYRNHVYSFNKKEMKSATELSKHIWSLKEAGTEYRIDWEIVREAKAYRPGGKYCNLCTSEAIAIAFLAGPNCLNSKSEIIKQCRHRTRWKLEKYKKF